MGTAAARYWREAKEKAVTMLSGWSAFHPIADIRAEHCLHDVNQKSGKP